MSDDLDRDKLYSADVDEEDGDEYELEPPDPEVLEAERRRGAATVATSSKSIDIDQIYRDLDDRRDSEVLRRWFKNFRFQFQIKHLLIATAVVAVLITLGRFLGFGGLLAMVFMVSVLGMTLYLQWEERRRQQQLDRQRRQMYAERRAHFQRQGGATPGGHVPPEREPDPVDEFEQVRQQSAGRALDFRFSLAQLLIAITAAAVVLGGVSLLGGPQNAATLLGLIALAGLGAHALGYEPPGIVAFGWWVLLVLYIAVSIVAGLWNGLAP